MLYIFIYFFNKNQSCYGLTVRKFDQIVKDGDFVISQDLIGTKSKRFYDIVEKITDMTTVSIIRPNNLPYGRENSINIL